MRRHGHGHGPHENHAFGRHAHGHYSGGQSAYEQGFERHGAPGRSGPGGRGMRGAGPGGMGGGGFGGARRGKLFTRDELRLMVLALLQEAPRHGYELMRAFEEKSGGAYVPSPGILYPLLAMLEEMELVQSAPTSEGKRRQVTIAEAGIAELDAHRPVADAAFARLAAMASASQAADAAPVRRAMINLRTALGQRLERAGDDAEIGFAIAALLDEAAQRIERL